MDPTSRWSGYSREVSELICSAKGCRQIASFALRWNNPKLHDPDRRKSWLACPAHLASLSAFLEARGFLRSVDPLPPDTGPDQGYDPSAERLEGL
jgi:hypothetical protein